MPTHVRHTLNQRRSDSVGTGAKEAGGSGTGTIFFLEVFSSPIADAESLTQRRPPTRTSSHPSASLTSKEGLRGGVGWANKPLGDLRTRRPSAQR